MGFITRALVPRPVRRAAHPVRTARRAATPRPVKQARRALHPVSNAAYSIERSLNTKPRSRTKVGANQVVFDATQIERWYVDTANAVATANGLDIVTVYAVCEPDPTDSWACTVTGHQIGKPGSELENWEGTMSQRLRCQPDGGWHVEGDA